MRKATTVFVCLVACAFTAGNLVVTVSAATPAQTVRTSSASGTQTSSPAVDKSPFGGSRRDGKLGDAAPAEIDFASLKPAKPPRDKHPLKPLLVRNQKAYDD